MRSYLFGLLALIGIHSAVFGQILTRTQKADSILKIAKKEVGLREITGHNDHPRIDQYRSAVSPTLNNHRPRYPYCGFFVYWCFVQAGQYPRVYNPGRASAWFETPSRLIKFAKHGNTRRANSKIKRGMVAGYKFMSYSNRISHVEIIDFWDDDDEEIHLLVVGGNTGSSGSMNQVIREGDGVYFKKRQKSKVAAIADWID
jgi:hypothetical protein